MKLLAWLSVCALTSSMAPSHPLRVAREDPRLRVEGRHYAFEGQSFTGEVEQRLADGSFELRPIRFGLTEGSVRSFYLNGALRSERSYLGGEKHGLQREWYPDGRPKLAGRAEHDIPEGAFQMWFPSGLRAEERHYVHGQEVGVQRVWFSDGVLRANYVVRDGRRYGTEGPRACTSTTLPETTP